MIRLESEIEFPPSPAQLAKAAMLTRMESLKSSSDSLMNVIQARISAEEMGNAQEIATLTAEQERIITNMKSIVRD
ncbi:MAG: hypothetical protein AB8B49_11245 [Nitratireductor sp.]